MVNYIITHSGKRFTPLNPCAIDIDPEDVAYALSNLCRFTGHCHEFYSVAEHSIRVAKIIEGWGQPQMRLEALLHDATEAYLSDLSSPVKMDSKLIGYRYAEDTLRIAVAARFGLPSHESALVKHADQVMLVTEMRDLMGGFVPTYTNVVPLNETIVPMSPSVARKAFLEAFTAYGGK